MAQDGPRWPRMAQDGPRWPKLTQDGPNDPDNHQSSQLTLITFMILMRFSIHFLCRKVGTWHDEWRRSSPYGRLRSTPRQSSYRQPRRMNRLGSIVAISTHCALPDLCRWWLAYNATAIKEALASWENFQCFVASAPQEHPVCR
jgi:hypothetical protein